MTLHEQAGQTIAARKLFERGGKILVAVSGGVDSVVLLHVLHQLAAENKWRLAVAHFNHQLRGRSSDADEKMVGALAKRLRLKFVAGRADVRKFAGGKKLSIEMAARELRHEFLARTARRLKISRVALAHHADDQVELFFLRLLRGSGGDGLAGMKWISSSPADPKIKLIRPLLGLPKSEIEKFARENKIRFREDASNRSADFLRNRIRNELLPLLRKNYSAAVDRAVLRAMEITGAEAEFVAAAARSAKMKFGKLPVTLQRRLLQAELRRCGVTADFELIERLRAKPDETVPVDSRRCVSRDDAGKIQIVQIRRAAAPKFRAARVQLDLGAAGSEKFSGLNFSWAVERPKGFRLPKRVACREFFDADAVGPKIVLRHWRAGDRFQPIGMGSAVKLQDLFVNAKIPAARRRGLILATTSRGEIFWVEGLRIGERFKLRRGTRRRLGWRWG